MCIYLMISIYFTGATTHSADRVSCVTRRANTLTEGRRGPLCYKKKRSIFREKLEKKRAIEFSVSAKSNQKYAINILDWEKKNGTLSL